MPRAGPSMPMAACIRSDRRRLFPLRRTGRVGTSPAAWWRGPAATAPEVGYLTATEGYILLEWRRPWLLVPTERVVAEQRAWDVPTLVSDRTWGLNCVNFALRGNGAMRCHAQE